MHPLVCSFKNTLGCRAGLGLKTGRRLFGSPQAKGKLSYMRGQHLLSIKMLGVPDGQPSPTHTHSFPHLFHAQIISTPNFSLIKMSSFVADTPLKPCNGAGLMHSRCCKTNPLLTGLQGSKSHIKLLFNQPCTPT